MGRKDPRVDAYITKSAEFARPILRRLRDAVHRGCPEVTEELKWSSPFFVHHGILCMMAAFKAHCTFGFWKHAVLKKRMKELGARGAGELDRFVRLASASELPDDRILMQWVKEAAILNESGLVPRRKAPAKNKDRTLDIPPYFLQAVRANPKARAAFESGSYTFRKEYVLWVTEAKSDETRERRLRTAVEWMAQGKGRNWKYEKR